MIPNTFLKLMSSAVYHLWNLIAASLQILVACGIASGIFASVSRSREAPVLRCARRVFAAW
jgi:hypothetical protein